MKRLTRKMLKEKYPYADEDYLVAMTEGKIHVVNYMLTRKREVSAEFNNSYFPRISNIFISYLNEQKRDYFLPEDRTMLKAWKKKIKNIISEFFKYGKEVHVTSVTEIYNYKRLYNLWMISAINGLDEEYVKPVVGEADEGKDKKVLVDPQFSKKKLNALIKQEQYGKTFNERMSEASKKAAQYVDTSLSSIVSGNGKELNQYLKKLEPELRKKVTSKINSAIALDIEGAEDFSDYDVFSANPFFNAKFQRVEVLDKSTCLVCASLDMKLSKESIGRIHPNCRGVDVPVTEGSIRSKEMHTNAARKESFNNWFNSLSEDNKLSLLGKTKYDLYKAGKLNVHSLVKQSRVVGALEVKRIEQFKVLPTLKNDLSVARSVIKNESKKLSQKSIPNIKTKQELNAYFKYVDKKEGIYRNLETSALKKAGVNRNTLNAEVNRERKLLRLKQKELEVDKLAK